MKLKKSSIPLGIKPKTYIYEVSQEMGFICPEYKTTESKITREINKQLPPNVIKFDEIPGESKYYKTVRNENFMIFKNTNLIIFHSPFQVKLFMKHNEDIFVDGIFYIASRFSYQMFIIRTYIKYLNSFHTTSFSILKNKEQITYEMLFEEIKKKYIYIKKYSNNTIITQKKFSL